MNRRQFGQILAGLVAANAAKPGTRVYALQSLQEKNAVDSAGHIVLEAIVAPRTPHWVCLADASFDGHPGTLLEATNDSAPVDIRSDDPRLFELRVYHSPGQFRLDHIFHRAGIRPLLSGRSLPGGDVTYLIPFDSLAERQAAWTAFSADPEWAKVRNQAGRVSQVAIYRRYPGGKIFEMSL